MFSAKTELFSAKLNIFISQLCSCRITASEIFFQRKNDSDFHLAALCIAIAGIDLLYLKISPILVSMNFI